MNWIADVNARGLVTVAEAIGLTVRQDGTLAPCPACGAETRDAGMRRGPIGTRATSWKCWRCGMRGGPLDLVIAALFQKPIASGDRLRWAQTAGECQRLGLLAEQTPIRVTEGPRVVLDKPKDPPAIAEVLRFWQSLCVPVVGDVEVSRWLTSRRLDPSTIAARDLARALLPGQDAVPEWAACGDFAWHEAPQAWRTIVPLFDHRGIMRSVHARALHPRAPKGRDKARLPRDRSSRGFVMANNLGRLLLAEDRAAISAVAISDAEIPSLPGRGAFGLVIVEGIPDFLTAATTWQQRPFPAVFGILNGSWTPDLAMRVPDRTRVLVATDPDDEGEKYAALVHASLGARCEVFRWRGVADVNEIGLAGGGIEPCARVRRTTTKSGENRNENNAGSVRADLTGDGRNDAQ